MRRIKKVTYTEYKDNQIERSDRKWGSITFWRNVNHFDKVVQMVSKNYGTPKSICCMGIRVGNEYKRFKELGEFKNTDIYGVDIHPKVEKVGTKCFCYDFSKLPKSWEKKFDWIYSNSIDHAYDLQETLKEWHRVCKKYLIIGFSSCGRVTKSDVYDFVVEDISSIIDKNLFEVMEVWEPTNNLKQFTVLLKIV